MWALPWIAAISAFLNSRANDSSVLQFQQHQLLKRAPNHNFMGSLKEPCLSVGLSIQYQRLERSVPLFRARAPVALAEICDQYTAHTSTTTATPKTKREAGKRSAALRKETSRMERFGKSLGLRLARGSAGPVHRSHRPAGVRRKCAFFFSTASSVLYCISHRMLAHNLLATATTTTTLVSGYAPAPQKSENTPAIARRCTRF